MNLGKQNMSRNQFQKKKEKISRLKSIKGKKINFLRKMFTINELTFITNLGGKEVKKLVSKERKEKYQDSCKQKKRKVLKNI